jgi:hypothetical protein
LGRPRGKAFNRGINGGNGFEILEKGFASLVSYYTFAVLIFERFIKLNINAYHSTTCKKRPDEIDV